MVSPLIDRHDLATRLATGDPPPVLLDVRWALGGPPGLGEYRLGHIPGAHYVDLERELSAAPGPGRHPLPEPAAFEAAMRRHCVTNSRPVIVYDAATGTSAARAWWLLRYFGHPDVALLDGGFAAWKAADLPLAVGDEPDPDLGDFSARPGSLPLLDALGAVSIANRGTLVDARAQERYRGEVEPIDPVAGHIPGARNLPALSLLSGDNTFLSPPELRDRFAAVGVRPGEPVGVYCGSGVVATQEVFAMALAGIDAALYAGSWSEWITDPTRPVETGG
jgi:thiosulfate/3-mercaptopyruvate sulfurtransferase